MSEAAFSTWGKWSEALGGEAKGTLPDSLSPNTPLKGLMGWDGVALWDPEVSIVDMARAYMARAKEESCGQCFPCRLGTKEMSEILERICAGQGEMSDLDRLETLARLVMDTARCDIGQTTPRPILDCLTQRRGEFKKAIEAKEAIAPGNYISKITAPCMNACPSHVDIPAYLEEIRFGNWEKALEIVRNDCPMPGTIGRVCVRPCESACRRGLMDDPLAIKGLKRYIADQEIAQEAEPVTECAEAKEDKIAIIGAGPGGVSCAYYLARLGYKSVIFEAMEEPGGMAAVGIPDYRLPRNLLRHEVALVEKLGVEIRYGVNVGQDLTLDEIAAQGFKAVFVAVGAPESSSMRCEGEDAGYQCFMTGIGFLKEVAQGKKPIEGKKMLVIGGGNVAMDCVRTALRQGFTDVNLLYRRTEAEMPADQQEIDEAQEEGVKFHYLIAPKKVLAENGKVTGLECLRMELGEPDASGRRRPVPIEGSDFVIETDAIVPAIGQICVVDCVLPSESELELTRWKTLVVDEVTFQSKKPNVFGGGDCITGPDTLIAALAAGKRAAGYIAQYLQDGECQPSEGHLLEDYIGQLGVFDQNEKMAYKGFGHRKHPYIMAPEERIKGFDEVEGCLLPADALQESSRCLRCYRLAMVAV